MAAVCNVNLCLKHRACRRKPLRISFTPGCLLQRSSFSVHLQYTFPAFARMTDCGG